jgi:hypothetical protein
MMPLKRDVRLMHREKRTLPTASDKRGTAKATYSDGGRLYVSMYLVSNPETQRQYGITDGSLFTAYADKPVCVGDRIKDIESEESYEVLQASSYINGWTLSVKRV